MCRISARKYLWVVFLVELLAVSSRAQDVAQNQETQDIYLSFNYSGLVSTVITGLYYRDSVFIPISDVFNQLRVENKVDIRGKTLRGFYIKPSDKYEIDFGTGIADVGGRVIKFDTSKVIVGQLDFYVLPSLFDRLFDLEFNVDFNSLSMALSTTQELPVVKDYQRENSRNYLVVSPQAGLIQAPLKFPQQRSLLNGGILDYSLSGYNVGGQSAYSYQLTAGAEVLGGETEWGLLGSMNKTSSIIYSSNFSWKYAFDSTSYITYAELGNISSNGLTEYGFRGAQISNQPLTVRTLFSEYVVTAQTKPNWEVELYLNGQLVEYKRADAQGRAEFSIPLVYGTSFLQIKYYGPDGQFNETDRRLQIPYTFMPVGQLNYTVSAGKLDNTDENLVSANAMYGATDWLTDKVGMDYLDSPLFSRPLLYNSLYLRLSPEYMLSIDAAPSAYYTSTFNALYASQAAFDLSYSRYDRNSLYNPSEKSQGVSGDAYAPFSLGDGSFNIRVAGTADQYVSGQSSYTYSGYLSASLSQLNASIGYLRSIMKYSTGETSRSLTYTGSLLYSLAFQQGGFDFLNGTLISLTGRYGVLRNSLDDISLQLSKSVQQYIRVTISAERDYVNHATNLNLQVIADLPFTRATASAQDENGAGWYTGSLSGSIGFDSNYGSFLFNDLGWVGHSAASMRMFVDSNGNGKYDKGEEVIQDGQVGLRQATSTVAASNGIIRDWNLLPYTQYSADVDVGSIRNPLWIPRERSFSFITDPNSYKRIDIPFFVGGIVDGTVLRLEKGHLIATPGLNLEIKSDSVGIRKTVNVFNDGSFYYMGLPPGDYEAYVDSSQLASLGVYSDPKILHFTVKPTKNGDFVEGLKIILKTRGEAATAQPASPKSTVTPPPKAEARQTRYVVQIGAFASRERAARLAKWAGIMTGYMLEVRFNPQSGFYVVQSDTFESRRGALGRLGLFINKFGFSDAFVTSAKDSTLHYNYYVQVAALRSTVSATEFAARIKRETGLSPIVQLKRSTQLYSVMVGPYGSKQESEKVAQRLKKREVCRDAFVVVDGERDVPRMYTVVLGTFSSEDSAKRFTTVFRQRTGLMALVGFDRQESEFRALTPTFRTYREALAILKKIRSFSQYSSAEIVSFP